MLMVITVKKIAGELITIFKLEIEGRKQDLTLNFIPS
jgi:hypothetical protein